MKTAYLRRLLCSNHFSKYFHPVFKESHCLKSFCTCETVLEQPVSVLIIAYLVAFGSELWLSIVVVVPATVVIPFITSLVAKKLLDFALVCGSFSVGLSTRLHQTGSQLLENHR